MASTAELFLGFYGKKKNNRGLQLSLETFSQFALKKLMNLPNVKDIHTSFSLGQVKASSALPLGHLVRG